MITVIDSVVVKEIYQGDGATTHFPFSFPFDNPDFVKVAIYTIATEAEETLTSDYFVDTNASEVIYPGYPPGEEPPEEDQPPVLPSTQKLIVYRSTPISQLEDLGDKYPLPIIEDMVDKITMIAQELNEKLGRTLTIEMAAPYTPEEFLERFRAGVETAVEKAAESAQHAENSKTWSEGSDADVEALGGTHSSEGWSDVSKIWAQGNDDQVAEVGGVHSAKGWAAEAEKEKVYAHIWAEGSDAEVAMLGGTHSAKVWAQSEEKVYYINNVAAMRADAFCVPGMMVMTKGYYYPNDGGAATYNIRAAESGDTDDGGSIIILDNGNVAELITNGTVNVKQFGAKGDGTTNDTTAFENALTYASGQKFLVPTGSYVIDSNLFADGVKEVTDNGTYTNMKPAYPNTRPLCNGLESISVYPNPKLIGQNFTVGNCYRLQSMDYDSTRDKFVLGLISADESEQVLAVVNPTTLAIESSHTFTALGHCNSIMYLESTDCFYINGVLNANNVTDYSIAAEVSASTWQIQRLIPLGNNISALSYDPILKLIVGITGSGNDLYIYTYDLNFDIIHTKILYGAFKDSALNGTNENVSINGRIVMFGFMYGDSSDTYTTGVIYETDIYGNDFRTIPFPFSVEPEGACYYGGKIIFTTAYLNATSSYNGLNTLYQITANPAENSLVQSDVANGANVYSDTINLDNVIMPGITNRMCANGATGLTLNYPKTYCEQRGSNNGILYVLKGGDTTGSSDYTQQLFFSHSLESGVGYEIWQRKMFSTGIKDWKRVDCYGALPNSAVTASNITGLTEGIVNEYTPDRDGFILLSFSPSSVTEGTVMWSYMREYFKFSGSGNNMYPTCMTLVRKGVTVKIKWVGGSLNASVFLPMG